MERLGMERLELHDVSRLARGGARRGRGRGRRKAQGVDARARRDPRRRARVARGLSRARQDARRPFVRPDVGAELRTRPVHARPAALRPHRIVRVRPALERLLVPSRTAVHRAPARRRDQPHAAADAVRPAGGDAGAPDHRRGRDVRARAAVPRAGDGEPDRVRGHVSAPGGPARSVHDAHELRLSVGRRGVGRAAAAHGSPA